MEKRTNILPLIMLLLFIFITLSSFFEINPLLYLVVFVVVIVGAVITSKRLTSPRRREVPIGSGGFGFTRPSFGIGRWIIIPIAIVSVLLFILLENWMLNVNILKSMYLSKALLDWWKITFLDNHYFYTCIAIGLLIAISDPRIVIKRDSQGKRRLYFHSKFWSLINVVVGQVEEYRGSPLLISAEREVFDDLISFKRGMLWKVVEFVFGALVIGPLVAKNLSLTYLMISNWIETQQLTWTGFIQNSLSVLYTRLFNPGSIQGFELGAWLITNSPSLEFLLWLRTLSFIVVGLWSARLLVSAIMKLLQRNIIRFFRDIIGIGFLLLVPYVLQIPTQAFDVTTPFYVRTIITAMAIFVILLVFLSLQSSWVQLSISRIFRTRVILFSLLIIVSASLLYGPVVVAVQYAPAMGGRYEEYLWQPKYLPNVVYTRWATGLESIKEDDIDSAMNTGTNLEILRKIRVFNDASATLRLQPNIGVNWMDFPSLAVDIINANGKEYWVAPLTIIMPPGGTSEDQWRSSRMLITHSERILALDAATGDPSVQISSVFNLTTPYYSMYYGEGGLFASSPTVYLGLEQYNIFETHLTDYTGPPSYTGTYDYILDGFERLWFFSGIYGREQLRWDFGRGDYGPVNMLFLRDVRQRLSQILLPGMTIDDDPYIVSDGNDIYYSMYVYINRDMPTEYLDYPEFQDKFWRVFATVLINAYDGSIKGYFLLKNESNYVLDFYRSMYPQWDQDPPDWLLSQLRYPEFLFEQQIDSYNLYHVSSADFWQRGTDFFSLTTGAGQTIEDVRYVSFYLNETVHWAAVRLVEFTGGKGGNLAGLYVALNGKDIGDVSLLRTGSVAFIGPQTAIDTTNNFQPTNQLITLNNWQSGNILMYVIDNRPYYFIPYYGRPTATTIAPTMMVIVDAISRDISFHQIENPNDRKEVGSASEKAYFNLRGLTVELTAEARRKNVTDEFERRGYILDYPDYDPRSYYLPFEHLSVDYLSDADWSETNSTISSFISSWAEPYSMDTIYVWETIVSDVRYLQLGVIVNRSGIDQLRYITIAYG